jgi:hypothetical protein
MEVGVISLRSAQGQSISPQLSSPRARLPLRHLQFAVIILLAACIHAEPVLGQLLQSENQSNTVHGTVVNAVTHDPIGRALVYSPDNRYATFTDSEGHFEFTLPKPAADSGGVASSTGVGRLSWLMARKPGFLDHPNGEGVRRVEITPGTEVTIPLVPEALIKGRVTLSAADPANRVNVQLFWRQVQDGSTRWIPKNSARTNSNGEFRFAELQSGTYKVLTSEWMDNDPEATVPGGQVYGFPPVYYPSATDFASASTIQLTAGQTLQADLTLVRQPYYPVKIPVANMGQEGGLSITVSPQGLHGPGYSLGFNRRSGTIEGQLPNGKYLIEAATNGQDSSASGSVNITVAGARVEGPGMVLNRNNSIPVIVREEFSSKDSESHSFWSDGKHSFPMRGPRLDLQITAEPVDDFDEQRRGSLREPTGPNDDSLVLENLAPGRYWLRLTANRGYVASASMGGTDLLREPLAVVPGAGTPIEITLRDDNAELDGALLGVAAASAESVRSAPAGYVYCVPLPDSPGQFLELAASPDGKFDYQTVTPGVYRVIAFSSPQRELPYRDAEAMKTYEAKGQVVHFAAGQKVSLQLEISPSLE